MPSTTATNASLLAARILLALIFVLSGVSKLGAVSGTMGYMEQMGVPGILVYPTIALEILGGLAIIVGYQTRLVALALAVFTVIAAVLFHSNLGDQMQFINFMKNLAIAGGFLALFAAGAGAWALDTKVRPVLA